MPLPTPAQAASARAQAGIFERLGSSFLRKAPYISPLYNVGSSVAHLIKGTQGQYGPPPTVMGKLFSLLRGNPNNTPLAPAAPFGGAPGVAAPPAAAPPGGLPAIFQNAYPSSFGNFNTAGETYAGGPIAGFDSVNGRPVYNARGVIPRTAPNTSFSAYGPGGLNSFARTLTPYDPASGPIGGVPSSKGIPGNAQAFMNWVRSKNIA